MTLNLLEYLEHTIQRVPDKIAYADEHSALTFRQVYDQSRAIGTFLAGHGFSQEPIAVFINRHPKAIPAYFGVLYSGNYYMPLDIEMSPSRIEGALAQVQPRAIICDAASKGSLDDIYRLSEVYMLEEVLHCKPDTQILQHIRCKAIDTDPAYIVFTSGSTGQPKGVIASHRSVIDYIENLSEVLNLHEGSVLGNQTPLYLDACLKELYPVLKFGGTAYIIPKSLFMFPIPLIDFLNRHKINTICWVSSALSMIVDLGTLDVARPEYLTTVAFGSEVFPVRQLKLWRDALPKARFINLYGPTEATGMSCYYEAGRDFSEDETIPIGKPFKNTRILLLSQDNQEAPPGALGEICISGAGLALGYYGDKERTDQAFVQNPLNNKYPERIYRTGDLGRYNERGELLYVSRLDDQIKHRGYRIELGEIEAQALELEGVQSACCLYDGMNKKILLLFSGSLGEMELLRKLKDKLPGYMVPNRVTALDPMPKTPNNKIDRTALRARYITHKG